MFGSTMLEIATGVVFVFLLVSLICSQVGSKISEMLNWRARDLEKGIRDILFRGNTGEADKANKLLNDLYGTFHVQQFNTVIAPTVEWAFSRGLLKGNVFIRNKKDFEAQKKEEKQEKDKDFGPIKLPAQSFALGIIEALVPDDTGLTALGNFEKAVNAKMPESPLKSALLKVTKQSNATVADVRTQIEAIYNHAEEQMTAFYAQHMWQLALTIGLFVSIVLNVDSIAIGVSLWRNPDLRAAVNVAAAKYSEQSADTTLTGEQRQAAAKSALDELNNLNLPVGWQITQGSWRINKDVAIPFPRIAPNDWAILPHEFSWLRWLLDLVLKSAGWLITAVAAAQGAPFWFDVLRKLAPAQAPSSPQAPASRQAQTSPQAPATTP